MKLNRPKLILPLYLGFTAIIIVILIFGTFQIQQANHTLENTIQIKTRQTDWLHHLQVIADQRSFLIMNILHTEDVFDRDDLIQRFYLYGEDFIQTRTKLMQSQLVDYQIQSLQTQAQNSELIVSAQHYIFELLQINQTEQAHHHFITIALPLQQENSTLLNNLVKQQVTQINHVIADSTSQLKQKYLVLGFIGLFIIISGGLVSLFVYRYLTANIQQLSLAQSDLKNTLLDLKNLGYALDQHAIVSIADTTGRITFVNEKFCEISQYQEHELLNRQHSIINSGYHEKQFFRDMWATIISGETWQGEIRNQKKDGSYYWVETTIVPFLDKNNIPYQYVAIRTEITHIKEIEEDLQLSFEQLVMEAAKATESNTLKDSIISTMTHELRTPLNAILGFSELLLLQPGNLTDLQIDNINTINESGQDLLQNIDNILLYSKLKSHSLKLYYNESDLVSLIQSAIAELSASTMEITIKPELITLDQNFDIFTDTNYFKQALCHILHNAIKFTASGHITIAFAELSKNTPLPGHYSVANTDLILLTIEDTGIGISPEKIQIIFDEFRQADEKANRQFDGYGIGLTLAKNIITLHKGEIWLTSELGKGTTVYITIPKHLPV